jgi:hypothetical protein
MFVPATALKFATGGIVFDGRRRFLVSRSYLHCPRPRKTPAPIRWRPFSYCGRERRRKSSSTLVISLSLRGSWANGLDAKRRSK